jgi:hypothetical protein
MILGWDIPFVYPNHDCALQLDPKVVFLFWKVMNEEIFPMMEEKCLEYVTPFFDVTP